MARWTAEPVGVSVYLVTNRVNGKQYVGYTCSLPEKRWSAHKTQARRGSSLWFHQALRKHGEENFDWRVVSVHYTDAEAKHTERALIAEMKPAYNMTEGGDGTGPMSPESRAKLSAALSGRKKTPEHIQKIADANRGRVFSEDVRRNMSAGQKGKKFSAEVCLKRSQRMLGHAVSDETRARIGKAHLGNKHALGYKHSPESIQRMRLSSMLREAQKRGELQLWL